MRINMEVSSMAIRESLYSSSYSTKSSLEKLSTGLSLNKASDDPSGLAIADKLRTEASSLKQGIANINSAITLTQIADKAMAEQSNILDVVKQKLIQAGTATTSEDGIEAIGKDISKLLSQVDNIASQTTYNGTALLQASSGSNTATASLKFQVGNEATDIIATVSGVRANIAGLNGMSALKLSAEAWTIGSNSAAGLQTAARAQIAQVDSALTQLNGWRADFGSTQNQLESSAKNLATTVTNIKNAEGIIRDTDFGLESANFTKSNIVNQAGTFALSQANASQNNVLSFLQ